jgi:hypothetical protein
MSKEEVKSKTFSTFHLGAFFAAKPQKTGLSAAIPQLCLWQSLRDFHFNPVRGRSSGFAGAGTLAFNFESIQISN